MPEKRERMAQRDDELARCFRCGQLYPSEYVMVRGEECPAAFRGHPLCGLCAEAVKGKKRTGWWAEAVTACQ